VGDVMNLAGSADADGVPTITKATLADGNATIGPIVGFEPSTASSAIYLASGSAGYVYVADDPNLIFEVQCESNANLAATSIGLNAILVETHSGNTTTGLSGQELDTGIGTAPSANASNMLVIVGMKRSPDNSPFEAHGIAEVMISVHKFGRGGGAEGLLGV